jgi:hypothetical protein
VSWFPRTSKSSASSRSSPAAATSADATRRYDAHSEAYCAEPRRCACASRLARQPPGALQGGEAHAAPRRFRVRQIARHQQRGGAHAAQHARAEGDQVALAAAEARGRRVNPPLACLATTRAGAKGTRRSGQACALRCRSDSCTSQVTPPAAPDAAACATSAPPSVAPAPPSTPAHSAAKAHMSASHSGTGRAMAPEGAQAVCHVMGTGYDGHPACRSVGHTAGSPQRCCALGAAPASGSAQGRCEAP